MALQTPPHRTTKNHIPSFSGSSFSGNLLAHCPELDLQWDSSPGIKPQIESWAMIWLRGRRVTGYIDNVLLHLWLYKYHPTATQTTTYLPSAGSLKVFPGIRRIDCPELAKGTCLRELNHKLNYELWLGGELLHTLKKNLGCLFIQRASRHKPHSHLPQPNTYLP